MKCPKCKAKLLPVDGEMFCLQCGSAIHARRGVDVEGPSLEETTDPVLQKAILDSVRRPVHFKLPVSNATSVPATKSFSSMRALMASQPTAFTSTGAAAVAVARAPAVPIPVDKSEPVPAKQRGISLAWMAGIGVFGIFMLLNGVIYEAYANRVYPGVRVGASMVGGVSADNLATQLKSSAPAPQLAIQVGPKQINASGANLGVADVARAGREAMAIGHNTPLPLAGLLQSVFSKPVVWTYIPDKVAIERLASGIAKSNSINASAAAPVVFEGQAFAISEKPGLTFDAKKVAALIAQSLGRSSGVSIAPDKTAPTVTSQMISGDIQDAQNTLSVKLQISVKGVVFQPSAKDIGNWITFEGPGKGVAVDGAGVATYVASIPGKFDRSAATSAAIGALQSKHDLTYAASTRKVTPVPQIASIQPPLPRVVYSYCLASGSTVQGKQLADKASSVLNDIQGWSLGGSVRFVQAESGCNFSLALTSKSDMVKFGSNCINASSCLSAGVISISSQAWQKPPKIWTGSIDSYRFELMNHEMGHWLGFEHASCTNKSSSTPVLTAPTVQLDGCSPNWYAVPVESLATKKWSQL